eukprot:8407404-Pyramimonas_sp.AAC.1
MPLCRQHACLPTLRGKVISGRCSAAIGVQVVLVLDVVAYCCAPPARARQLSFGEAVPSLS